MNLSDPRNVILTVPEGFQFSMQEYERAIGCRIKILEIPITETDTVIKDVISHAEDRGIKVRVKSWNPLLFEKEIRNFNGEPIKENFSILALRILGRLNDVNGEVDRKGRIGLLNLPDGKKQ